LQEKAVPTLFIPDLPGVKRSCLIE